MLMRMMMMMIMLLQALIRGGNCDDDDDDEDDDDFVVCRLSSGVTELPFSLELRPAAGKLIFSTYFRNLVV